MGVYRKLAAERPGTFLLESAEHDGVWSRYSFVGARCAAVASRMDRRSGSGRPRSACRPAAIPGGGTQAVPRASDPPAARPAAAHRGARGLIGYGAVRRLERLPDHTADDLHLPELALMLVTDLAVLDHADGSVCSSRTR